MTEWGVFKYDIWKLDDEDGDGLSAGGR